MPLPADKWLEQALERHPGLDALIAAAREIRDLSDADIRLWWDYAMAYLVAKGRWLQPGERARHADAVAQLASMLGTGVAAAAASSGTEQEGEQGEPPAKHQRC